MPRKYLAEVPSLLKFWDWDNNLDDDPSSISHQSGFEYNLKCPDCQHRFKRKIHGLKNCKFCVNQARCDEPTCDVCFNNSLASKVFATLGAFLYFGRLCKKPPTLANIVRKVLCMNAQCAIPIDVEVRQVAKNSNSVPLRFMCRSCWHVFTCEASRVDRLKFCPFCSTVPKELCRNIRCDACFNKSFASHPKSDFWDTSLGKNQGLNPRQVFKSGTHLADFTCGDCRHSFQMTCNAVSSGFWCPYCAGQRRCQDDSCDTCSCKKLSSHPAAKYWRTDLNPEGITPDDISLKNGREKWWFDCENGVHPPYQRDASHIYRNQLCSECSCPHKTERMVCDEIHRMGLTIKKEFAPKWCRTGLVNSFSRFDVCIEDMNILVEIDGVQHFEEKWKFDSPEKRRELDIWKMTRAVANGFSGIRLYQPDVFDSKVDWQSLLRIAIERIRAASNPIWLVQAHPAYVSHIQDAREKGVIVEEITPN